MPNTEALRYTREHTTGTESLPWESGLSQLEQYLINPYNGAPQGDAITLLEAVAGTSQFMLAILYSDDLNRVNVIPLPEVRSEDKNHMELGINGRNVRLQFPVILNGVFYYFDPKSQILQNKVVLIEKNYGAHGEIKPITIANLNTDIDYPQKKQYMDWIETTQKELNTVPPTGKYRKNAV